MQVFHLGSGRVRTVDADAALSEQVQHRLAAGDANAPPTPVSRPHPRTSAPLPFHQLQTSEPRVETLPVSPDLAPRVVSCRLHPVRSEADFRRSGTLYSSEWHAPVGQGGPGTYPTHGSDLWMVSSNNDRYNSRWISFVSLARGTYVTFF